MGTRGFSGAAQSAEASSFSGEATEARKKIKEQIEALGIVECEFKMVEEEIPNDDPKKLPKKVTVRRLKTEGSSVTLTLKNGGMVNGSFI